MDIEQLEALALSDDRSAAVAHLVPGSEDHDYWRAIAPQHRGALAEVDALLATWRDRHGDSEARRRLQRRQRLPSRAPISRGTATRSASELVVHAPARGSRPPPSATRPRSIRGCTTRRRWCPRRSSAAVAFDELTQDGVRALAPARLDPARRRLWLERVNRGGLPGLVAVIADDLAEKSSRGFGSLTVHGLLTAAELDELVRARPPLAADPAWVAARPTRLRPPEHVDWSDDLSARIAYLDALLAAVAPLPPVRAAARAGARSSTARRSARAGRLCAIGRVRTCRCRALAPAPAAW